MIKKCLINVAINSTECNYVKGQNRLCKTLEKHNFDGDYLFWSNQFPNQNYNTANTYNCKAAAFEEALKMGYTQLLWLDASAIVVKSIQPIFDKIKEHGYYTLKNWYYTCDMTCSDKCLAYYCVSRDEAEKMQEHASGIIGIDYTNPKGKALLDSFIKGCKESACDGSRSHDNQSSDPRFLFHRQDQSVLSMSANILKLPPIDNWENLVAYHYSRNSQTVIMWPVAYYKQIKRPRLFSVWRKW